MSNVETFHKEDDQNICPECGSRTYRDEVRGEQVCSKCGLVVAERQIAMSDESRTDERHPFLEADDSVILPQLTFTPKDFAGRKVKGDVLWGLRRTAKTYNLRPPERSTVSMETRIKRLASQHSFSTELAARAIYLFRKARKMRLLKKPGLNEWSLALILTACRENGVVVTIEDLVSNNATSKEQKREKKRMRYNVLRYHHIIAKALKLTQRPPTVIAYVVYFGGKLGVSPQVARGALEIARDFVRPNVTPHCIAAASLYISNSKHGFPISQKNFCAATNISEISLRHWTTQLGMDKTKKPSKIPAVDLTMVD